MQLAIALPTANKPLRSNGGATYICSYDNATVRFTVLANLRMPGIHFHATGDPHHHHHDHHDHDHHDHDHDHHDHGHGDHAHGFGDAASFGEPSALVRFLMSNYLAVMAVVVLVSLVLLLLRRRASRPRSRPDAGTDYGASVRGTEPYIVARMALQTRSEGRGRCGLSGAVRGRGRPFESLRSTVGCPTGPRLCTASLPPFLSSFLPRTHPTTTSSCHHHHVLPLLPLPPLPPLLLSPPARPQSSPPPPPLR